MVGPPSWPIDSTPVIMTITVPSRTAPAVTIVMVTYGHWDVVEATLDALVANTEPVYELVVVDNASPDQTGSRLRDAVGGAHQIHNRTNVGFGAASNQGALLSRSPFLCFLNSDTLVEPGWLPPLLATMHEDPTCAAVVPCKLNRDGSLQEAASLVGGDGGICMYGLGADPTAAEYRFARRVDYGGAACLLVRRPMFSAVGGFAARYGIGYYEDVDLCFSMRRRGWHTMYQPGSVVRHLGGASTGREAALELAERNRLVFRARWAPRLRSRPTLGETVSDPAALTRLRDHESWPRVLVFGTRGPDSMADLALAIARHWPRARVTLVAASEPGDAVLGQAGVEVVDPRHSPRILSDRRDHYSVVIAAPWLDPAEWRTLDDCQPRARLAWFGPGGPLLPGPTPPTSRADVALALAPVTYPTRSTVPVVALGCPIEAERLEEALSYVGVAPARPDLDRRSFDRTGV
jgi:GT2 family glycosyltransferase